MLSQNEIDIIISVMKPYNPKKIGIFGSCARGENSEESDIDILYQFEEPISLFEKAHLLDDLQQRLSREIDLISEKYLHPYLRENILNDVKVIYGA